MSDKYDLTKEYWIIRVQEQAEEIKRLTAERDGWRKLVLEHNAECKRLCVSGEAYCHVIDSYSGCVTCPESYEDEDVSGGAPE